MSEVILTQGVFGDGDRTPEDTRSLSVTFEANGRGFVLDTKDIEVFWFLEDIFSHSMTGVLRFRDTMGFSEFAPLTGDNEFIHLTYGRNKDINLTFDVYAVKEVTQTGAGSDMVGQNVIEVHFVDDMFQLLTQQKFSRSFKELPVSDIVRHIARNMLQQTTFQKFEASSEQLDFVMPYWTVKQALMWLLKRGTSSVTGTPGYLFYKNSKGLNFVTLDALLQGSVRVGNKTAGTYRFEVPEDPYFLNRILGWTIQGIDNFSINFLRGCHKFGYDFSTKSLIDNKYEFSDGLKKTTVLGRKGLYADIGTPRARFDIEGDSDSKILDSIYYNNFAKRYTMQQAIKIIVKGHEDRFAGDLVEIEWPSTERGLVHNQQMKGLYLVKSITHQWASSRPSWVQKMVLLKNGYTDSRNLNLSSATKRNLYGVGSSSLVGVLGRG